VKPEPRTYRRLVRTGRLCAFQVTVKETDLHVQAGSDLTGLTRELVIEERGYLEAYIRTHPEFAATLAPWSADGIVPEVVARMTAAGAAAGVGPMAAVAGAIAERVGQGLLAHSEEVVVENGGDIFMKTTAPATAAIYAGNSPLSLKVGLKIDCGGRPRSVCTSSGTVGHSLSFGKADAVCIVSRSCALADAAATAVGNRVRSARDIPPAIEFARTIRGVEGVVVIVGAQLGAWGDIELVEIFPRRRAPGKNF
jgi:hypothetical protein